MDSRAPGVMAWNSAVSSRNLSSWIGRHEALFLNPKGVLTCCATGSGVTERPGDTPVNSSSLGAVAAPVEVSPSSENTLLLLLFLSFLVLFFLLTRTAGLEELGSGCVVAEDARPMLELKMSSRDGSSDEQAVDAGLHRSSLSRCLFLPTGVR